MKKFIVTTTINEPTEAIRRFDALAGWTLIVVGDQKTPEPYTLKNGIYLTPAEQEKLAPELSDLIGWNCIQRRNLGFVLALDLGAELVATVDDDNIPYPDWGSKILLGTPQTVTTYDAPNGCFDPIGATEHGHLWHRGYPLQLLSSRDYSNQAEETHQFDVQAEFWDGDPDIDAVCRMEHAPTVKFDAARFPFCSGAVSPFNSQNTILTREALAHYFMAPGVGRMDDIWGAFHVYAQGFRTIYCQPSVRQDRNQHDLTKDLEGEILGYRLNEIIVRSINEGRYGVADYWPEQALRAFDAYRRRIGA